VAAFILCVLYSWELWWHDTRSMCDLYCQVCSRITSTISPSFCMTTFSLSLTNLMALLPHSYDCNFYLSRWILACPPYWLQEHTYKCLCNLEHSPDFYQLRLAVVTCSWSCRLHGITSAIWKPLWGVLPSVVICEQLHLR
jgi:hypothetical protein